MLHWSAIYSVIEKNNSKGKPVEFSMQFVKMNTGELINVDKCVLTSSHFRPRTINIRIVASNEIRKVRCCSITKLNDERIYV